MGVWQLQAGVSAPDISVFVSMLAVCLCCRSGVRFCLNHQSPACVGAYTGLYPGGGVWVWMRVRQGVILPAAGKGVERVKRGEPPHGAGDHGYGVRRHERDVVRRSPHGQSVVRWAGSPQHHVVRVQGVANTPAVPVQVRVLLHLQGHDLLLLSVSQVVGGVPLGAAAPVDIMPSLVLLVVKRSEGQNVEE